MRREENGPPFVSDRANDGLENIASDQWIEAGTGLVQKEEVGAVRLRCKQTGFGGLTFRKCAEALGWIEPELSQHLLRIRRVPFRIKGFGVPQQFIDAH